MADLVRYHINGLQFYDWMYRHEQFLTEQEPYLDPLGRLLSRATVEAMIDAAHRRNIAAMPYTAIYAASVPFYKDHPDWALYQAGGQPYRLGEDFLIYMDPRPASPWTQHLLAQFKTILQQTPFDGIHLDQYGDPKQANDVRGNTFDLAQPLAAAINTTREVVRSCRPDGAVVFNAVNNWPIEAAAPSAEDLVYIEVWPPHTSFQDLHNLIVRAQELGGGKPVVLAAYIDPTFEHNARLVDAVIFASGGGHIELGERGAMLAEAYFPRYQAMSPGLARAIGRYYDFAVRYQDVIGSRTDAADHALEGCIEVEGVETSAGLPVGKVWPIAREGEGFLAISLINLLDVESPEWAKGVISPPRPIGPSTAQIRGLDRRASRLWFASPDTNDPLPRALAFDVLEGDSRGVAFQMPSLAYWNLVVIEWSD
jgi:dextranase